MSNLSFLAFKSLLEKFRVISVIKSFFVPVVITNIIILFTVSIATAQENEVIFESRVIVKIELAGLPENSHAHCDLELANPLVPPFNLLTQEISSGWSTIFFFISLAESEFRKNGQDPYSNTTTVGLSRQWAISATENKLSELGSLAGSTGHFLMKYIRSKFFQCRDYLIEESLLSFTLPVYGQ